MRNVLRIKILVLFHAVWFPLWLGFYWTLIMLIILLEIIWKSTLLLDRLRGLMWNWYSSSVLNCFNQFHHTGCEKHNSFLITLSLFFFSDQTKFPIITTSAKTLYIVKLRKMHILICNNTRKLQLLIFSSCTFIYRKQVTTLVKLGQHIKWWMRVYRWSLGKCKKKVYFVLQKSRLNSNSCIFPLYLRMIDVNYYSS